jgi:hypothetical protein
MLLSKKLTKTISSRESLLKSPAATANKGALVAYVSWSANEPFPYPRSTLTLTFWPTSSATTISIRSSLLTSRTTMEQGDWPVE